MVAGYRTFVRAAGRTPREIKELPVAWVLLVWRLMPSPLHEALVLLFRECPALGLTLARDALHVDIPAHTSAQVVSAEFTELVPAEYRADVVLRLDDQRGNTTDVLIIEAQLQADADKSYSWHLYAAGARCRYRCPATVVAVTLDERVARWSSRSIAVDRAGNTFRPLVLGPEQIPAITNIDSARALPELAVLSAMAHGHAAGAETIGLTALAGCKPLDNARASLYADIIYANMGEIARRALEVFMDRGNYTYQTEFAKQHYGAGHHDGEVEGRRIMLLEQLEERFGALPAEVLDRIQQAGPEDISMWGRRILTADSVQAVFAAAP
jgi:hypothetical protein